MPQLLIYRRTAGRCSQTKVIVSYFDGEATTRKTDENKIESDVECSASKDKAVPSPSLSS